MNIKEISSNSFSFIGDGVYTLKMREYFVLRNIQKSDTLQILCNKYNSAKGQMAIFDKLKEKNFFNEIELDVYKRGRNNIRHIPKNGDLITYSIASGFEAIVGYLYLADKDRLEELFVEVYREIEND